MPKLKPPFKLNVPMLLTWMRIAMIPLVIGIFYLPETWMTMGTKNATAMLMFVIAAITDALDGFLARRYQGWATPMGAFLDPVADKLLVSAALVALVGLDRCDMLVALVIIGREITISALREWMAQIGASRSVAVHMVGKLKTTAQMIAIPFLLYDGQLFGLIPTRLWGTWLIYAAVVLTIWSMAYYLQKAVPEIRAKAR